MYFYCQESEQGSIKGRVESDSDSEDYGKDVVSINCILARSIPFNGAHWMHRISFNTPILTILLTGYYGLLVAQNIVHSLT